MIRLLAPLMALVTVWLASAGAFAQVSTDDRLFTIAPGPGADPAVIERGFFVYELAPGSDTSGSLLLYNPTTAPVTVELAAVDAGTAQGGGADYADASTVPTKAGTWLHLTEPRVTIDPRQEVSVGFTARLPQTLEPGQYLAGIVAYVPATQATPIATTGANDASASIVVQTRDVIPVQFDVPGAWAPSMSITGASALEQESGTRLGITMQNTGDTFIRPEGRVILSNAEATPIISEPIELGTFITGTNTMYPIVWPGDPVAGQYAVDVQLNYADDKVASYRSTLDVSDDALAAMPAPGEEPQPAAQPAAAPAPAASFLQPWMIYTIIGLLALLVILFIVVLLRGRRSSTW
ncbi:MAG: DUF916 domain-containing protein [Chloroflexota bacterium]|nr:DUF916 domain-containing protein [Chloroflexota bacterium]